MILLTNLFLTLTLLWFPLGALACISQRYLLWSPLRLLNLNYSFFALSLALTAVVSQVPQYQFLSVDTHVASNLITTAVSTAIPDAPLLLKQTAKTLNAVSPWKLLSIVLTLLVGLGLIGLLKAGFHTYRSLKLAYKFKAIGSVRIYLMDELASPFAFSLGLFHVVVLPQNSMQSWKRRQFYLKHELQHIRQGDTHMAYAITALQWMFFWHPFFWLWKSNIEQIQEISCDCFLIGHKKISFKDYTNCLLETHQIAREHLKRAPLGVTLAFWRQKKQLLWRVKFMNSYQLKKQRHYWGLVLSVPLLVCGLIGTAYASKSLHRRSVDKEFIIKSLDAMILGHSELSVETEVEKALSDILNSPEQRRFYRASLQRLKSVDRVIDTEMLQYGVPRELKAMALVESGFQNLPPQRGVFERSTGMWQIIAQTAKALGLQVSAASDERMDINKATNAAIRYIVMNRARFDNWDLSVLSYNAGENAVAAAVRKAGSKDPMEVRKYLHEETQRYYINVLTAAIIMSNPGLVAD